MDTLKKYWPQLAAVAAPLLTIFAPQIQALISAHPVVLVILAGLSASLAHLTPSPSQQNTVAMLEKALAALTPDPPKQKS